MSFNTPQDESLDTPCPRAHPQASLFQQPPSLYRSQYFQRLSLSQVLLSPLDRVNVLGDDARYGHTGCVNALSWARNGDILLSGGDDTTIRIWGVDVSRVDQDYPFVSNAVIRTGHRANIFSAQMLPHSTKIATAAGDKQIRVFDVKTALSANAVSDDTETEYSARQTCSAIIRCHSHRAKRVVTEDSPDIFLTVSEDGSVRQHDLRTPHNCRREPCPAPLVQVDFELSTLSVSPLTPYQLVVAGESPFGYLFDRRHLRRKIQSEWGSITGIGEGPTTCVRKFGRDPRTRSQRGTRPAHITGCRVSSINGHEVLLSYSADGVYLFSTRDEPTNKDDLKTEKGSLQSSVEQKDAEDALHNTEDVVGGMLPEEPSIYKDVPMTLPRRRFVGAKNVATVKDVNFLGPNDESVVSGSDDGNFFIWNKRTAAVTGIYEGDGSVVNMVEGHPSLPLIAVSGIDTTVKLFAPNHGDEESRFSKLADAANIVEMNQRRNTEPRLIQINLQSLLEAAGREGTGIPDCATQ